MADAATDITMYIDFYPIDTIQNISAYFVAHVSDINVERQPPCPRATTTLAGFQAAEVGVFVDFLG